MKGRKSKAPFEAGELVTLEVGTEEEENYRKYVVPQKHPLVSELKQSDEACVSIRNLPFGFTEENLEKYFSHFGEIVRCAVPSNSHNGKFMGRAYVHFKVAEVAKIACSTMHNYPLFGQLLKCTLIPGHAIKKKHFTEKEGNRDRKNVVVKQRITEVNKIKSNAKEAKSLSRRNRKLMKTLADLEFEVTPEDMGLKGVVAEPEVQKKKKLSSSKKTVKDVKQSSQKSSKPVKKLKSPKTKSSKDSTLIRRSRRVKASSRPLLASEK